MLWLKKKEVVRRQRGDDRLRWRWKKTIVSCSATPALASSPSLGFSSHFDRDEMSESRDLTMRSDLIWRFQNTPFPCFLLFTTPPRLTIHVHAPPPPMLPFLLYFLFSNFTPLFLSFCRVNILSVSSSFLFFFLLLFFFFGPYKKIINRMEGRETEKYLRKKKKIKKKKKLSTNKTDLNSTIFLFLIMFFCFL